jgi:hypothetical protein
MVWQGGRQRQPRRPATQAVPSLPAAPPAGGAAAKVGIVHSWFWFEAAAACCTPFYVTWICNTLNSVWSNEAVVRYLQTGVFDWKPTWCAPPALLLSMRCLSCHVTSPIPCPLPHEPYGDPAYGWLFSHRPEVGLRSSLVSLVLQPASAADAGWQWQAWRCLWAWPAGVACYGGGAWTGGRAAVRPLPTLCAAPAPTGPQVCEPGAL